MVKSALSRFRRTAKRILRPITSRWLTRRWLARDLQRLGVRRGGILVVHSSLSCLGFMLGGPRAVILALLDAIDPEGTLMMPAHTWEWMEAGCRCFDARSTPCCVGVIAEAFRRWPGTVRSLHLTHSVTALGPLAEELIVGHELARTPCGPGTPYLNALERDCQILHLGLGLQYNTEFYTIEALAEVDYQMRERPEEFTIVDMSGAAHNLRVYRHRRRIPHRPFGELEPCLLEQGVLRKGLIRGHAPCLLLRGRAFLETMLPILQRDPGFMLKRPTFEGPATPTTSGTGLAAL
jgi:aminoglycoside 3-N-acetyltransferase